MVLCRASLLAVLFGLGITASAMAGGAHTDEEALAQAGFFGFVRDAGGNAVVDAKVTANFTTRKIKLIARSDPTGAYMISKLGDNTDPKTVIIACDKDGYRFDKLVPRNIDPKPGQPDEVDCILAKN